MNIDENKFKFAANKENNIVLTVHLTPNAKSNEVTEICDEFVKIKVKAQPVDNKANKELIIYLSKLLHCSKSSIELISGEKSRLKRLLIKDKNSTEIIENILFVLKSNQNN